MKAENSKLWLNWDKVYKQLHYLKWQYAGTPEKKEIEHIIEYVKKMRDNLEKE